MSVSRRTLVAGTASLAGVAAIGIGLSGTDPNARFLPTETSVLRLIRRTFGRDIANDPEARQFAKDMEEKVPTEMAEVIAVFVFITKTNVIRAMETNTPLVYVGLETLEEAPCRNTLSANWL